MTTIELSNDTEQRLEQLAVCCNMTRAALLNELIEQGLADMETEYQALSVLERVRSGKEPIYSAAETQSI